MRCIMQMSCLNRRLQKRSLSVVLAPLLLISVKALPQQAQSPAPTAGQSEPAAPQPQTDAPKGGMVHGTVKAGNARIPGVSVTATNTLTGKKYATTTDINGAFTMAIPQNGRYVLKTDLAAFAPASKEAVLNATTHDQAVDFEIVLASRAAQAEARETAQATRQYNGSGAQNLNLANALAGAIDAAAGGAGGNGGTGGASGAQLPSIAGNTDFSGDSVAISGQTGVTNPFAGLNGDQIRESFENQRAQDSLSQVPGQRGSNGNAGGGFFGGGGPGGGDGGGFFGGGGGGGGGGRGGFGNFRRFRPDQPHGAIFWQGGNSALNAEPYALRGQTEEQPSYASNRFGLTLIGEPFIPKLTKPSTKDTVFLTVSGQRTSTPFDQYAAVPTSAERTGDFSGFVNPDTGQLIPIYDPTTGLPFPGNQIPSNRIPKQAQGLLNFVPLPNLPGGTQNYHLLTTQQNNTFMLGTRYIRNIGQGGGQQLPAFLAQFGNQKGLRQNINVNFNYNHTASDRVNISPQLGGKLSSNSYSLQLGYTIGYGKLTNNLTGGWNYTHSQTTNFFTNVEDIATTIGILGPDGSPLNPNPLNYGIPSVVLSQFAGLNQTQPNFLTQQTISIGDSSSWVHGKHNIRFGMDYRRAHRDLLGSTNATGTFYFTGFATQHPGSAGQTGIAASGSALADLLLDIPQQSTIQTPENKAYMRANVWDFFGQDDYRVRPNLTLLYGLRYEYFSPYSEKYDRLSTLDYNSDYTSLVPVFPNSVGPYHGKYPRSLIYPYRWGIAPRVGFAWRPLKETVVRGGYGINFTNGQFATFITQLAYQPPFANVQTNQGTEEPGSITLANGFPAPQTTGNFSINPHYHLPYVQVWNLNIQRTLPHGIVLNIGYNGAKGTHLDIRTAPREQSFADQQIFYFNDALAFSNFNAGTFSAAKRLQRGISLRATYTYSHGIDNASSIGAGSTVVAQNWQNLLAEEGNSSFDVRNKVTGTYLYELPFGPDRAFLNTGNWLSHALSGLSISGDFTFASGTPLTPTFAADIADVARGTAGTLRPNHVPGISPTAGAGTVNNWFNTAAYSKPANGAYGNVSRYSIRGPGTVQNDMSLSKTIQLGETRSFEMRATANNVFNTVQYSGVDTNLDSTTAGQVTSVQNMRQFTFNARFRF